MTEPDYAGLGRLVRERREELGLSQDDVKVLGGPSTATQRKIERGEPADYRLQTLWPLERVFGWRPGAINGYLHISHRPPDVAVDVDYTEFRRSGSKPAETRPSKSDEVDLTAIPLEQLLGEVARRAGAVEPPRDES